MGTTESIFAEETPSEEPRGVSNDAPPHDGAPTSSPKQQRQGRRPSSSAPGNTCHNTTTLRGVLLGLPQSGKRTLLQRLQGQDPFSSSGSRQATSVHEEDIVVPYVAPTQGRRRRRRPSPRVGGPVQETKDDEPTSCCPCHDPARDKIQLHLSCMASPPDDQPLDLPADCDFVLVLIHPLQHSTEDIQEYLTNLVQELMLARRQPSQQQQSSSSSPPRPLCVLVLINFCDLLYRKAEATNDENPALGLQEGIQDLLKLETTDANDWLFVQCLRTSLLNCFGLQTLHHVLYQHCYLRRKLYEVEQCRLLLLQLQEQGAENLEKNSCSYSDFLTKLSARKNKAQDRSPRHPASSPASSPSSTTTERIKATPVVVPTHRAPPPLEKHDSNHDEPEELATGRNDDDADPRHHAPVQTMGRHRPVVSSSRTVAVTIPNSRDALEAFLASDSESEDEKKDSRRVTRSSESNDSSSSSSSSTAIASGRRRRVGRSRTPEDDDDDDYFYDERGERHNHTTTQAGAPQVADVSDSISLSAAKPASASDQRDVTQSALDNDDRGDPNQRLAEMSHATEKKEMLPMTPTDEESSDVVENRPQTNVNEGRNGADGKNPSSEDDDDKKRSKSAGGDDDQYQQRTKDTTTRTTPIDKPCQDEATQRTSTLDSDGIRGEDGRSLDDSTSIVSPGDEITESETKRETVDHARKCDSDSEDDGYVIETTGRERTNYDSESDDGDGDIIETTSHRSSHADHSGTFPFESGKTVDRDHPSPTATATDVDEGDLDSTSNKEVASTNDGSNGIAEEQPETEEEEFFIDDGGKTAIRAEQLSSPVTRSDKDESATVTSSVPSANVSPTLSSADGNSNLSQAARAAIEAAQKDFEIMLHQTQVPQEQAEKPLSAPKVKKKKKDGSKKKKKEKKKKKIQTSIDP